MSPLGVPFEFVLFGLTLVGIAVFHRQTLRVSLIGLAAITLYKLMLTGFDTRPGVPGLFAHFSREWVILCNLLLVLMGFALLADHFDASKVSEFLPKFLPQDWKGGFVLLAVVWVLSSFLDNIAGALIGGATAHRLFRDKVHIAFLAAIVAASNAGGCWSVIGDTTTTMMWIAGIPPSHVFPAIIPAIIALFVFGIPAAIRQQRHSPILKRPHEEAAAVDWLRVGLVALILIVVIGTNFFVHLKYPSQAERFPFIGVATWIAIVAVAPVRCPNWSLLPHSLRGSIFLLALVSAASMIPVQSLPTPSWKTTLGLGFLSAIFDNIPLTALALKQGGYDWAFLAYAVGFGGSMIWFGSSAGVAVCNMYREARSVVRWVRYAGWIIVAYVISFFAMLGILHWSPDVVTAQRVIPSASFAAHE